MNIDFTKLCVEFKRMNVEKKHHSSGMSNVMSYLLNHYSTSNVDFNSFTVEEITTAFHYFYFIPTSEDEVEMDKTDIENHKQNYWFRFYENEEVIAELVHNKKKVYMNEDDFI